MPCAWISENIRACEEDESQDETHSNDLDGDLEVSLPADSENSSVVTIKAAIKKVK